VSRIESLVRSGTCFIAIAVAITASTTGTWAATWWVDKTNPACSDTGPGTEATPYCNIKPGGTHALPGDSVLVKPGIYREQVTPPKSGLPGSPITYMATAPGVVLVETDSLSDPAGWSPTATTAWSQPFAPPSVPRQVFLDGTRLTEVLTIEGLTTNSFFFDAVAKVLYVDIGGANPADGHQVDAGARSYGFLISAKTDLIVDGFEIHGPNIAGVRTLNASSITVHGMTIDTSDSYGILSDTCTGPLTFDGNSITNVGSVGIRILNTTGAVVSNNISHHNLLSGIVLFGSNNNQVIGNTLYNNVKPLVRTANGIDLDGASSDNLVQGNTAFHNDDTGIQFRNNANRNVVVRNVSYMNGDHGFDTRTASDIRYISNTAYKNFNDGFSIEGNALNVFMSNNIAVDNGTTNNENNLFVDLSSAPTWSGDYDIFINTLPGNLKTVRFNNITYDSFEQFKLATGLEPHGIEADPLFVDAAGGDLHLRSSASPAVDSADASVSGFALADHDGRTPVDLTTVADTGAGSPTYADRGAYEFDAPPTVVVQATPSSGMAPLLVTVTTTGTSDPDSTPIATYTFDFGDGTVVGPQAGSSASHTYNADSLFTVVVTVTDTAGNSGSGSTTVNVNDAPPVARLTLTPTNGFRPLLVTADASASTDTDVTPIATYTFNFGDGIIVGPQAEATAPHTYNQTGNFTVTVTVRDTAGLQSTATGRVTVRDDPPVARLTVTPTTGQAPLPVVANASASTDVDPTPIASYTFDFDDGTIVGPQASPIASHTFTSAKNFKVKVTVRDTAGLSSTATVNVMIKKK
jgi:parallel beta-helix repeat protein